MKAQRFTETNKHNRQKETGFLFGASSFGKALILFWCHYVNKNV